MPGGKEEAPETFVGALNESPLQYPTPQMGVFQRESSSSSSIRGLGRSTSSNSPFFTAQRKISQQPQPRKSDRTIKAMSELSTSNPRYSQRVSYDTEGAEGHRRRRINRGEPAGHGQGNADGVVEKRPPEVLPDHRHGPSRQPMCPNEPFQIGLRQHQIGGFQGDVGSPRNGTPHIGGRERRGVVDAVADHEHGFPSSLEPLDEPGLPGGGEFADPLADPEKI